MSAVHCIVFDETKKSILLVKRRDVPVWVFPGGGIDPHETPAQAATREVLEESGYQVEIARKVAEYIPVNRLTQPTHLFECRVISGSPKLSEETAEVAFFPLDRLPKLLPHFYHYWIDDALQNHPDILHKKIRGVSYWMLMKLLMQHPILVLRFLCTKLKKAS